MTGEFPAQRSSNAENVSIWWRHHELSERLSYKGFANVIKSQWFIDIQVYELKDTVM